MSFIFLNKNLSTNFKIKIKSRRIFSINCSSNFDKFKIKNLFLFTCKNFNFNKISIKNFSQDEIKYKEEEIKLGEENKTVSPTFFDKTAKQRAVNTKILSGRLSNIKTIFKDENQVKIEELIKCIDLVDRVDKDVKQYAEKILIEIIRSPVLKSKFLFPENPTAHNEFADLFQEVYKITSLTEEDFTYLTETFISLDNKVKEFSQSNKIKIFDALYYYKKYLTNERFKILMPIKNSVDSRIFDFFTSFLYDDLILILRNIVYLENQEMAKFAPRMVEKMNYLINPKYSKDFAFSMEKKINVLQYYPRILKQLEDEKVKKIEYEKIERFLIDNLKEIQECNQDLTICVISNYLNFCERSTNLLEAYSQYIYNNLAGFTHEITIDLFFIYLQSNFEEFKNLNYSKQLLNTLFQSLKNLKTDERIIYENIKEVFYLENLKSQLKEEFEKWDKTNPTDSIDHPDYFYKKLFKNFIQNSYNLLPFNTEAFNAELFDKTFNNFKTYISFKK